MSTSSERQGGNAAVGQFPHLGRTLEVQRSAQQWGLRVGAVALDTRDLSAGIEHLFGKRRENLGLAVRVMEWDNSQRP